MRKRSKYRPKGANPTAYLMAIQGASLMSKTDALLRAEKVRLAVEDAARGQADAAQWRLIFDAVNMVEQLGRHKVVQGTVDPLQVLIERIHDRQRETGTRALYAAEIAQLRDFAADYAGVLCSVTQSEYLQAQRGVEDRIRRILSTERIPASVRVIEAAP